MRQGTGNPGVRGLNPAERAIWKGPLLCAFAMGLFLWRSLAEEEKRFDTDHASAFVRLQQ